MAFRPWLVVLEMMQFGDVRSVLMALTSRGEALSVLEQVHIGRQIAVALQFVTEQGFVHMDVAARNVLLHTNSLCKLADFGIVSWRGKRKGGKAARKSSRGQECRRHLTYMLCSLIDQAARPQDQAICLGQQGLAVGCALDAGRISGETTFNFF